MKRPSDRGTPKPARGARLNPRRRPLTVRAQLALLRGAGTGRFFDLSGAQVVIGRDDSADITVNDAEASGWHACLEQGKDGHRLVDLDSSNGTYVDGQAVQEAPIRHGDRFRIGSHEFQYLIDDSGPEPEDEPAS